MPSIVLIAPPNPSMTDPRIAPPLGLLYLAGELRRQGVEARVEVVDLNTACYEPTSPVGHWTHDFSLERCMREIPRGADLYGVSLASMQFPHGKAILEALREREGVRSPLLVVGGSHASACPEEVAEWADVVVTQEGERRFVEVVRWWCEGATPPRGRHHLRQKEDSRAALNVSLILAGEAIDPLDDAPLPARDLLDWSRYTRQIAGAPATNIITSRGCPARCTFCQQESLWGEGLRIRSAPRILEEVDDIFQKTGIRNLLFLDDSLTARKRADLRALCQGLQERGVKWRGWTRANLCVRPGDREVLELMAASGCQAICVGVEAGTERLLKNLDKQTTPAMNRAALTAIQAAGMSARCSIMVGNPGETWEDVVALVEFVEGMREVVDDWILSTFVPLPGTPSWDQPEKYGIEIDKKAARESDYQHFYVVGGVEQSPLIHRLQEPSGRWVEAAEILARHEFVSETLLRRAPRDRIKVTMGGVR